MKKKKTKLLTRHGGLRFETRVKDIADRDSEIRKARNNGKEIAWYTGELRVYLNSKSKGNKELIVYDEKIYIFDFYSKKLITVFDIQEKYLPTKKYLISEELHTFKRRPKCILNRYVSLYTYNSVIEGFVTNVNKTKCEIQRMNDIKTIIYNNSIKEMELHSDLVNKKSTSTINAQLRKRHKLEKTIEYLKNDLNVRKNKYERDMLNALKNVPIRHKIYGQGVVRGHLENILIVQLKNIGTRCFVYPDCFKNEILKYDDRVKEKYINMEVKKKQKIEECRMKIKKVENDLQIYNEENKLEELLWQNKFIGKTVIDEIYGKGIVTRDVGNNLITIQYKDDEVMVNKYQKMNIKFNDQIAECQKVLINNQIDKIKKMHTREV